MLDNTALDLTAEERLEQSRERFLTSHRAIAACAREFNRLVEEVVERANALRAELMIEEEAELRLTPDRCIVQLGPVALTLGWLRGNLDSLADGRLLVIAWEGTIARRRFSQLPERANAPRAAQTATALWEETFVAAAENEASWEWQQEGDRSRQFASPQLAARAVDQLRAAWRQRPTT
jgi:hypothetical protein